ncbi:MAG: hypothetical protein IKZ44_10265 [Clostridia bacterium]|nr:hypothetical protein [Clostridia bacterium]
MKRIIILCLSLVLLLACVPTPKEEFVVNKGDDVVEQKLNETPDPDSGSTAARQTFPDRWDEDPIVENDRLIVRANTEIHVRADGLYPVYRTRPTEITKEMVENVAVKFLDKPTASSEALLTKEDWGRALQSYLDLIAKSEEWAKAGKPDGWTDVMDLNETPEELEAQTNWYMEQIRNAPASLSEQAVNDYSGLEMNKPQSFTLASGDVAWISFDKIEYMIAKGCKTHPIIYDYADYQDDLRWKEGSYQHWIETDLSREQAESIALSELERLGYTGYAVSDASTATLLVCSGASERGLAGGWSLVLKRSYGGYPQIAGSVYASRSLYYGSGDEFFMNEKIETERFILFVSEDGIQFLEYQGPKEISGLVNANVELLPFDEIQMRIKNALSVCFPYDKWATDPSVDPRPAEAEIFDMYLSAFTIREKNSSDYYEMPCWIVNFDILSYVSNPNCTWDEIKAFRNEPGQHGDFLIINAVDGSVVNTGSGW